MRASPVDGAAARKPPNPFVETLVTLHPLALAISYVLISFSATPLPPGALVRPMLVGVVATLAIQAALWLITRRRYLATVVTSALVLVSSAAWLPLGLAAAIAGWWLVVAHLRRRRGRAPMALAMRPLTRAFGVVVWVMVVVAAVPVAGILAGSLTATPAVRAASSADAADVVVLLLDGYPRADALERMGGDNTAFLAELEDRGFTTATRAASNYTSTWATLASMFQAAYLDELDQLSDPYPTDAAAQYRALMELIADAPALDAFRERGYEIVTMPPTLEGAQLTAADRVVSAPQMTAFELSLIQRSPLGSLVLRAWPSYAYGEHRARTEATLRLAAEEMRRPSERPRFVFAHVTSPHAPMVAAADGSRVAPPSCFPDCSMYVFGSLDDWERLPGQVEHLNDLVLEVVDDITAASPDATIVLMSDHGMAKPGQPEADILRSLFSARSASPLSFPDDIQPWQVLEVLANGQASDAPFRAWISAEERPLEMTPYTGPIP